MRADTPLQQEGYEKCGLSLARVRPLTGRMHQIRLMFAEMGTPVACDPLYGTGRTLRERDLVPASPEPERIVAQRTCLHSSSIRFVHPKTAEKVGYTAPLPADMEDALRLLRGLPRLSLNLS